MAQRLIDLGYLKVAPVILGFEAPPVPDDFRTRVAVELAWARIRALEKMPLPDNVFVRRRRGKTEAVRQNRGRCVGCGGSLDAQTAGCKNCSCRAAMRALAARRRSALTQAA